MSYFFSSALAMAEKTLQFSDAEEDRVLSIIKKVIEKVIVAWNSIELPENWNNLRQDFLKCLGSFKPKPCDNMQIHNSRTWAREVRQVRKEAAEGCFAGLKA